jgi:hypothetical protein
VVVHHAASVVSPKNDAGLIGQYNAALAGTTLAPGLSRSSVGLFWLRTFEPGWILFVYAGELDQVFDSEVSECLDAVVSGAIDPDYAVLDLHVTGDVSEPVFVFAEALSDTCDGGDMMELVDVRIHAARA